LLWHWIRAAMQERGTRFEDMAYNAALVAAGARELGLSLSAETQQELARHVRHGLAREVELTRVVRWLLEEQIPVALYGKGWNQFPEFAVHARAQVPRGLPHVRLLQESKVFLHINETNNLHPRVFECIAAGGFILCRETRVPDEFASCFVIGEEVITFSSRLDLVAAVRRAFTDEAWRKKTIEAGRKRVIAEHTVARRAEVLLEELKRLHGQVG